MLSLLYYVLDYWYDSKYHAVTTTLLMKIVRLILFIASAAVVSSSLVCCSKPRNRSSEHANNLINSAPADLQAPDLLPGDTIHLSAITFNGGTFGYGVMSITSENMVAYSLFNHAPYTYTKDGRKAVFSYEYDSLTDKKEKMTTKFTYYLSFYAPLEAVMERIVETWVNGTLESRDVSENGVFKIFRN